MEIAYCSRAPKPEAKAWTYVADPVVLAAQSDFFFVTLAATNNTLSSKVPSVFVALMLAACLRSAHAVSGYSRAGPAQQA